MSEIPRYLPPCTIISMLVTFSNNSRIEQYSFMLTILFAWNQFTTRRSQFNPYPEQLKRVHEPSTNGRHKQHITTKQWLFPPCNGTIFKQTATVQRYNPESGRTDLHSKAHHTKPGEI